jgi:hypothetical protein
MSKLRYCLTALRELLSEFNCSLLNICVAIKIHREKNLRLTVYSVVVVLLIFNFCDHSISS